MAPTGDAAEERRHDERWGVTGVIRHKDQSEALEVTQEVRWCWDATTGSPALFAEDMQRGNPRRWEAKRGELGIDDLGGG